MGLVSVIAMTRLAEVQHGPRPNAAESATQSSSQSTAKRIAFCGLVQPPSKVEDLTIGSIALGTKFSELQPMALKLNLRPMSPRIGTPGVNEWWHNSRRRIYFGPTSEVEAVDGNEALAFNGWPLPATSRAELVRLGFSDATAIVRDDLTTSFKATMLLPDKRRQRQEVRVLVVLTDGVLTRSMMARRPAPFPF